MMRIILIIYLVTLILCPCITFAGSGIYEDDLNYSIAAIPVELLIDAKAVIRINYSRFEIIDNNSAKLKVKKAVTIFNKDALDYGRLVLWYDKFLQIEDIEGTIYDAFGEEVRELDNDEIKDYSDFSDFSLYSDNRVKYISLYHDRFPYTVEFKYEILYDGSLNWPSWYSRKSTDAVEKNIFEVQVPQNQEFRYWCNNDSVKPLITNSGMLYTWKAVNLPRLPGDAADEDIEDYASIVYIAPSNFEIEEYKGNMSTWKEFGNWYNQLSQGLNVLPADVINEVKQLISGLSDDQEKIAKLYKYMQAKCRYVSVQLGIGGWKPFSADYVHQRGYGDCKALSNYMVSLLKIAGITAYPVLINSGHYRLPIITEFPSNQFNHVIVCVPLKEDSLWLECTSNITPPGFIGWNNENREALMITPEGGVIVKTPSSTPVKNFQSKNINVKFSGNWADVEAEILWGGTQQQYARPVAEESTPQEREKWINEMLEVPYVEINNYSFDASEELNDQVGLKLNMTLPKYASQSGNRIFFNPNLIERRTTVPKDYPERRSPVSFRYPYLDVDSLHYSLPEGYTVESLPNELKLQSSFAEYTSHTIAEGDSAIIHVRTLEVKEYSIPASSYPEYRKFFADVVKADKNQVVLIKKK